MEANSCLVARKVGGCSTPLPHIVVAGVQVGMLPKADAQVNNPCSWPGSAGTISLSPFQWALFYLSLKGKDVPFCR